MPLELDDVGGTLDPVTLHGSLEPGLVSAQQAGGLGYGRYNVRIHYVRHHGWAQLPTAGEPPQPAKIVRLHAPYSTKVVTWVVEAMRLAGERPTLPHWDNADDSEALIWSEIKVDAPVLQADGQTFFWHVAGEYHYAAVTSAQAYLMGAATAASLMPPEAFGLTEADFDKFFLRSNTSGQKTGYAGMVFDKDLD